MTEQNSPDVHPSDESLRAPNRWRVRFESTRITCGPSRGVPLTRSLGTILVLLMSWMCQLQGSVEDSSSVSVIHVLPQHQNHGVTTRATLDTVVHHLTAVVPLSVPLPPPPVPPVPAPVVPAVPHPVVPVVPVVPRPVPVVPVVPVVPHAVPVVPVVPVVPHAVPVVPYPTPVGPLVPQPAPGIPHSVPVVPYPNPVPPAPTWEFPRPAPVVPAPTRVFPPPVVVLEQVPNLVGDNLVTGEQVLIQNGLAIGSISRQASNLPAGTIVRTNPRANTAVPAGTTINLVVAG
jgi:hypothetical protein